MRDAVRGLLTGVPRAVTALGLCALVVAGSGGVVAARAEVPRTDPAPVPALQVVAPLPVAEPVPAAPVVPAPPVAAPDRAAGPPAGRPARPGPARHAPGRARRGRAGPARRAARRAGRHLPGPGHDHRGRAPAHRRRRRPVAVPRLHPEVQRRLRRAVGRGGRRRRRRRPRHRPGARRSAGAARRRGPARRRRGLGLPGVDAVVDRALAARLGAAPGSGALLAAARAQPVRPAPGRRPRGRPGHHRDRAAAGTRPGPSAVLPRALHRLGRLCPGLSWTVLAAVGQVESGHGRNLGPSSAGALGPDAVPAEHVGGVRRRRRPQRDHRHQRPVRRGAGRRAVPVPLRWRQGRRRAATTRCSPTTTRTGTSARCSPCGPVPLAQAQGTVACSTASSSAPLRRCVRACWYRPRVADHVG